MVSALGWWHSFENSGNARSLTPARKLKKTLARDGVRDDETYKKSSNSTTSRVGPALLSFQALKSAFPLKRVYPAGYLSRKFMNLRGQTGN